MSLFRTLFACLLIMMLALAGCGEGPGDDDDSSIGDDDDDSTASDDDDSTASDDDDSASGDDDDSASGDDDDSASGDDDDSASGTNPCASQVLLGTGLELDLSFEDGSGSTAADGSGNGRHATLHGNPTWASGYCGGGLSFDGTDDWAVVAGVLGAHTETSVTLEAWVYIPSAAPWSGVPQILGGGIITPQLDTGSTNNYRLTLNNTNDGQFWGRVETLNPNTNSTTFGVIETAPYGPIPFPVAQWTHLALTYGPISPTDPDRIVRLFVNSVERANNAVGNPPPASGPPTGTQPPLLPAADLGIAGWNEIGNAFFEGMVDDVRVWSEVRAPDQICEDGRGTFDYNINPPIGACFY